MLSLRVLVVKGLSGIGIFVVNLFEETIDTATMPFLRRGNIMICQVTLMTNQECISPQVLVSIEIVSLEAFARQLLAQELHLEHLIVVKTDYVAIVRVGVGNRLNRTSDLFTGRARPCLVHTGILSLRSSIIEERQALSVSENIDQFLQLLLSEVIVHLGCFKEILFSPRLLGQVSVVKG